MDKENFNLLNSIRNINKKIYLDIYLKRETSNIKEYKYKTKADRKKLILSRINKV